MRNATDEQYKADGDQLSTEDDEVVTPSRHRLDGVVDAELSASCLARQEDAAGRVNELFRRMRNVTCIGARPYI